MKYVVSGSLLRAWDECMTGPVTGWLRLPQSTTRMDRESPPIPPIFPFIDLYTQSSQEMGKKILWEKQVMELTVVTKVSNPLGNYTFYVSCAS